MTEENTSVIRNSTILKTHCRGDAFDFRMPLNELRADLRSLIDLEAIRLVVELRWL